MVAAFLPAVGAVPDPLVGPDVAAVVVEVMLRIALIVVIAVIARRLAGVGIRRLVTRATAGDGDDDNEALSQRRALRASTLGAVLGSAATVTVVTLAALLLLGELGVQLGPLIAAIGIVGLALGFGAQRLVQDLLSGLFILLEDQFGVGDVVDTGEIIGTVEGVNLRLTRVRDVGGTLWHLPNGDIRRAGNFSHGWARAVVDVDIAYDTDVGRATAVIEAAANQLLHDDARGQGVTGAAEVWGVQDLGADGVALRVAMPTAPAHQWAVERELRARIKAALDAEGLEIPFPQRTVWVRPQDPEDGQDGTRWRPTSLHPQPAGASRPS
jgi:small conductance mechanosensitive channel